jgi:hypothetical protein
MRRKNNVMIHLPTFNLSALKAALASLIVAAGIAATAGLAMAAPVPAGVNVFGVLSTDLNSANVNVGDGFSLAVTQPYPNGDASYANATIRGHVASVQRAGQGRKAQIELTFDRIFLSNGTSAPVYGHVVKLQQNEKNSTAQKAIGAGVGMLVGNYLGKHIGTNLGGLLGAGGGFLYANNLKSNITVPKGSTVVLQLDRGITPGLRQSGH